MLSVGMGAVYTRTSHHESLRDEVMFRPGSAEWEKLISAYFVPYARAFQDLVEARREVCGTVTIVDVHSFPSAALPYELHAELARPEICLGTDAFHTPDDLIESFRRGLAEFGTIGVNEPFIGTYVPLAHYKTDPHVRSVMIEIRRDLYMDEETGQATSDSLMLIGKRIAKIVSAL